MKVKLTRYRPDQALGLRVVRVPTISRHSAQEGGTFISPTLRLALPQGNIPDTHFC
jgi:hypothetical protein